MAADGLWTLDELVQRVADVLAGAAYPGAPNGRVRDVPDRRAVRWYATIGLVDRPTTVQGRTARYGTRHLLQLVAVKRRQAEGRALAEIQAELTGATDASLRRIAAVPDEALTTRVVDRPRFWTDRPTPEPTVTPPPGGAAPPTLTGVPLAGGALLLVPARPDPDDLTAIRAAAQPLLDLLAARGLLDNEDTAADGSRR
jgi:hypothetical protein